MASNLDCCTNACLMNSSVSITSRTGAIEYLVIFLVFILHLQFYTQFFFSFVAHFIFLFRIFLAFRYLRSLQFFCRYFIYTAKDLEEWSENPESFHHEQNLVQWTEKKRPCAEALFIVIFEKYREVCTFNFSLWP